MRLERKKKWIKLAYLEIAGDVFTRVIHVKEDLGWDIESLFCLNPA